MKYLPTLTIAIVVLTLATAASAQSTQTVVLYGIGASIKGTAQVGSTTADISVDTDTVFDNLEMAGMARYRNETPKWSFVVDGVFLGLEGSNGTVTGDINMTIGEFDAGYRFNPVAEAFAGIRYTDLSMEARTTRPVTGEQVIVKNGDQFIDPIIGVRFAKPLSGRWMLQGQGDVGGFGVGMNMQWQAMLDVGYRASDLVSVWLGYRTLNQDFDKSGENGKFGMDVTYAGPQAAVGFHF